ncbi:MAG: O-antigen ligase family protein [bacterium]
MGQNISVAPSAGFRIGRAVAVVHIEWPTCLLSFVWAFVALEGLFFESVTDWVVDRQLPVFRLLPFKLYPSDLILLPLLLFAGISAVSVLSLRSRDDGHDTIPIIVLGVTQFVVAVAARLSMAPLPMVGPVMWTDVLFVPGLLGIASLIVTIRGLGLGSAGRLSLLMGWWGIHLLGLVIGVSNGNLGVMADIRTLILRPLMAVMVFFLVLLANISHLLRFIVRAGIALAAYLLVASLLRFGGPSRLPFSPLYGGIPLLLPYIVVLSRIFANVGKEPAQLAMAVLIGLALVSTIAKPLVAGFLVCNVLFLLLVALVSRRRIIKMGAGVVFLLACAVLLVVAALAISGGLDGAISHVSRAYFKQDAYVQDLTGGRTSIWKLGLQRWLERPVFGHGLGYLLSGEVLKPRLGQTSYVQVVGAHNYVIEMLYKLGGVGTVTLLLLWGSWVRSSLRGVRSHDDRQLLAFHLAFAVLVLGILTMSMYGSHVAHPVAGGLLWFAVGVEAALSTRCLLSRPTSRSSIGSTPVEHG